jgi:YggT family protein
MRDLDFAACPAGPGARRQVKPGGTRLLLRSGGATSAQPLCDAERPMTSILQILLLILDVAQFIIIAHIIMSWLINFQVLNLRQPLVAQLWDGLNRLLEPIYGRVRSLLPNLGGIDLAPLVVLLAVYALRIVLVNNAAAFL